MFHAHNIYNYITRVYANHLLSENSFKKLSIDKELVISKCDAN